MKISETKKGVVLSYALLLCSTMYGLLMTPFILKYVGDASYGVYKSISSISESLAVMDLGLGTTMIRYMARYHATNEKEKANNFMAMLLIQFAIVAAAIAILGGAIYGTLPSIYGKTFSADEMALSKKLFVFLVLNMLLRLFENLLSGAASGYECFTAANGVKLLCNISKFFLLFILLPLIKNIVLVVVLQTVLVTAEIFFLGWYVIHRMGMRPKLEKWDMPVFKESMMYTLLMLIQSLTIQFNGNVDNILIGAKLGSEYVTMYSMALVIFNMYEQLSGAIAGIMLPSITRKIVANQSAEQLQQSVEKAGRYQFFLLAAAMGGFIALGREFFYLWLGESYRDCYWLTLMLIIPVTFPQVQNVCLSILRAQNKMGYRTVTLAISCMANIACTIVGITLWGYWGAAIGTACATILNTVFMTAYYRKRLSFRILKMYGRIFDKTWVCALVATICTLYSGKWFDVSWAAFLIRAAIFMLIYGALMLCLEMTDDEKRMLKEGIQRA